MTILTYFTSMVTIVALFLIFNKVMQSMFLAFYFTLPSCAASKADIIIILWLM